MTTTTNQRPDAPEPDQPSILVVDDEQSVADLYATFLDDDYDVTTVYGGDAALEGVDASYDVVLLDRKMPNRSGDEVLAELRARNVGCMVAMVTAVDPDFEIIEMPLDDYLVKPVEREELHDTVERLLLVREFDAVEYELSQLRVKRNVLKAELSGGKLDDSDEYVALQERIDGLRQRLAELREHLDGDVFPTPNVA